MPKVHKRVARKDYPAFGIKKGDTYYTWALYRQAPRKQKSPPTRSQLTISEFLSQVYDLMDSIDGMTTIDELTTLAGDFRDLGDDCTDKLYNMPEQLQQTETGQILQTRIDACEEFASHIEDVINGIEEAAEHDKGTAFENALTEIKNNEPPWD